MPRAKLTINCAIFLAVFLCAVMVWYFAICGLVTFCGQKKILQKYYTVMNICDTAICRFWGEDPGWILFPRKKHINLAKIPRETLIPKEREGIWNIFQDAAIVLDGLLGVGRYEKGTSVNCDGKEGSVIDEDDRRPK